MITNCNLEKIYYEIFNISSLQIADFSFNDIEAINMKKLEKLDPSVIVYLNHNKITSIKYQRSKLKCTLKLENNPINKK